MVKVRKRFPSSHKANLAARKKRERFNARHPEGRKRYSHKRRNHHCKWTE